MSLILTAEDLRGLEATQRALLSPLSHSSFEHWRAAVLGRVLSLTGADKGVFLAAPPGAGVPTQTVPMEPRVLQEYESYYAEREILPPDPGPRVHSPPDVVPRPVPGKTEIYTDFWRSHRQFDKLALTGKVEGVVLAAIFLHHENQRVTFGDRAKALLGLLLPAFEEGLRACGRWVRRHGQDLPPPALVRERFRLTRRETEVALLLARRRTNGEIAEVLTVSPHTVRTHTERIFQKLGVRSRRAIRGRLLED